MREHFVSLEILDVSQSFLILLYNRCYPFLPRERIFFKLVTPSKSLSFDILNPLKIRLRFFKKTSESF